MCPQNRCEGFVQGELLTDDAALRHAAALTGLTLCLLILVVRGIVMADHWAQLRQTRVMAALMGQDNSPCFTTDRSGRTCSYPQVGAVN